MCHGLPPAPEFALEILRTMSTLTTRAVHSRSQVIRAGDTPEGTLRSLVLTYLGLITSDNSSEMAEKRDERYLFLNISIHL